jgi:hypothetical protein
MKKNRSLRLSEDGRLPDGGLRFVVRLPKDLSDVFEAEMKIQDRKKLPMARYIIACYFKQRALRGREDPTRQQAAEDLPGHHFGALDLQPDATVRKLSR